LAPVLADGALAARAILVPGHSTQAEAAEQIDEDEPKMPAEFGDRSSCDQRPTAASERLAAARWFGRRPVSLRDF
jgi:hypothetical protein